MYQIFVVEDELLIRQNIRKIIEGMSGPYAFCGEASDGEMALSMMQDLNPDILLTDIRMPFLDGFELIRHIKGIMPWLRIVIISGYGDFEYAQKAISLGVDQYLLKPIRAAELTPVIESLAQQIEAEKSRARLPKGFDQDEVRSALREHFMQQLLHGSAEVGALLDRARALELDIVRPCYQVTLFGMEGEELDWQTAQMAARHVLEDLGLPLYHFSEAGRMAVLFYGVDNEEIYEQVYQTNNILRHELKEICPSMTTVVGSVVRRLSGVSDAYRTAADLMKKVIGVSAGQVIDVNDTAQVMAEIVEQSGPFGESFQKRLQYAAAQDIPELVDEVLDGPAGGQFGSMLMRYYALIDIVKMSVQMVTQLTPSVNPKDVATRLSAEHDIFAASGRKDSFRQTVIDLLQRVVSMKQENMSDIKYTHVISRAEEYIAANYCTPDITLISTARHVGMSAAHFSTVFSQTMGRSFIAYLTAMRIERAKELLANTDRRLSAIAMEIGYNEPNYFSHVFKKSEGMTPKEYRAMCQQ